MSCQRELEVAPGTCRFEKGLGGCHSGTLPPCMPGQGERGRLIEVHITLPSVEAQTRASPSLLVRELDGIHPKMPEWEL